MKQRIKHELYIAALLVALMLGYHVGTRHGESWGIQEGSLRGVMDCLYQMNKLAKTLTEKPL